MFRERMWEPYSWSVTCQRVFERSSSLSRPNLSWNDPTHDPMELCLSQYVYWTCIRQVTTDHFFPFSILWIWYEPDTYCDIHAISVSDVSNMGTTSKMEHQAAPIHKKHFAHAISFWNKMVSQQAYYFLHHYCLTASTNNPIFRNLVILSLIKLISQVYHYCP